MREGGLSWVAGYFTNRASFGRPLPKRLPMALERRRDVGTCVFAENTYRMWGSSMTVENGGNFA